MQALNVPVKYQLVQAGNFFLGSPYHPILTTMRLHRLNCSQTWKLFIFKSLKMLKVKKSPHFILYRQVYHKELGVRWGH